MTSAGLSQGARAVGATFAGRFTLVERFRGYGAGEAWKARDVGRSAAVLLKVFSFGGAKRAARVADFSRACDVTSSLRCPELAEVVAWEASVANPWVAWSLVDGPSLAERVERWKREGELPEVHEALGLLRSVAVAVAALHRGGSGSVAHGALSLEAVRLSDASPVARVVLLDAGAGGERSASPLGALVEGAGTAFMAPELQRGEGATPSSDVFALAALAATLLQPARRPPDGARSWGEYATRRDGDRVEVLRSWREGLSVEVAAVIAEGLDRLPERRPPDGVRWLERLNRATSLVDESAAPIELVTSDVELLTLPALPQARRVFRDLTGAVDLDGFAEAALSSPASALRAETLVNPLLVEETRRDVVLPIAEVERTEVDTSWLDPELSQPVEVDEESVETSVAVVLPTPERSVAPPKASLPEATVKVDPQLLPRDAGRRVGQWDLATSRVAWTPFHRRPLVIAVGAVALAVVSFLLGAFLQGGSR